MRLGGRWAPLAAVVGGVSLVAAAFILPLFIAAGTNNATLASLALKGKVDMVLYDADGRIKDERHFDNLIVNAGVEGVASRIAPHDGTINPSSAYNYIALGTDNTPAAATQTALVSELPFGPNYVRLQDATAQYVPASGSVPPKLILSVIYPPNQATGTLRESAIFNAASGGNMFARQVITPEIAKAAGDTLTVTWTITLSPS